jgi:hypothetical protein
MFHVYAGGAYVAFYVSAWPGWSHGKGLDAGALSKLLGPFGINPQDVRIAETVRKGYLREEFTDAWERYLRSSIRDSATKGMNTGGNEGLASATEQACSASQERENACLHAGCSAVADRLPS